MSDLLQNVNFLHDLLLTVSVLHIGLVNRLDRHVPASQLVYAEHHFSKRAFADQFDEFVELKRCRRHLSVLLEVLLIIIDELVSLFHD